MTVHRLRVDRCGTPASSGTLVGMDPAHLLRAARRDAALSQRALAARAGVALSVITEAESGWSSPRLATLDGILQTLGLELVAVPRRADADEQLRAWLQLSTSERLRRVLGRDTTAALIALGRGPFALTPQVSVAVWVPGIVVPPPVPVLVVGGVTTQAGSPLLDPVVGPWRTTGLVPAGLSSHQVLLVHPPDGPAMQEDPVHRRLRSAAHLLHGEMRRDEQDRRTMAHRDSRPRAEEYQLFHRWQYDRMRALPSETDRRDWRLGGAASLAEWLHRQGFEHWGARLAAEAEED